MKKLIPSLVMLLVSLMLLSTASYAWFSMNSQVTAMGMEVTATAEAGLLISNATNGTYGISASAINGSATVYPTTTADFESWYKAYSTAENDAMAGVTSSSYIAVGNATYPATDYYLENSFWLKTSTPEGSLNVKIDGVTVANVNTSAQFDASLRVAFVIGNDIFVYAPVEGDTVSNVRASGHGATWSVITDNSASNVTNPITATPTQLQVFCYYEGEDSNCKSTNLKTNMDSLDISFTVSVVTN